MRGGPVLVRVAVLAQLLADGGELAPQQHLALRLVEVLGHVVADAPAQARVGQPLALGLDRHPQAGDHVGRLEQLQLALEGDLGGVAGRVGQLARVPDAGEEVRDPAAIAAQVGDLLDQRAVLARQLVGLGAGVLGVRQLAHGQAQAGLAAGGGGAELGAVDGLHGHAARAVRQVHLAHHRGDRAVRREPAVDARHEHDAPLHGAVERLRLLLRRDREGHAHARKHHRVVEGEDGKDGALVLVHAGSRGKMVEVAVTVRNSPQRKVTPRNQCPQDRPGGPFRAGITSTC